jgi:hypothetical protein
MSKSIQYFIISFFCLLFYSQLFSNCITGNCYNGKGTFLYEDGSKYVGTFFSSKPHGSGYIRHADGSEYQGNFKNGQKNGYGSLTFANGDVYSGNFENNEISGSGTITYKNGDSYTGQWSVARANGRGRYTFSDGDVYEGDFMDGQFSGYGKLTRKDGSYYEGQWFRNMKHGKGISYVKGNKIVQYFDMNKPLKNTDVTKQKVENSSSPLPKTKALKNCNELYCHEEEGKYQYGDGSVYTGQFINGQGEGMGECLYINGDRYKGEWKNHAPHGQGTMFFKSGNRYTALWEDGKPKRKLQSEMPVTKANPVSSKANTTVRNDGATKIYALIVGIATYTHMSSLKYTDDDAYQLFAFLKSPEGGAIPDNQIKILIDDGATNQAIKRELKTIADQADANDAIILYMSGHGIDGAYIPSDFDGYKNQLPYNDVLSILNLSKAKNKLFIADACHSGSMVASSRTPLNISLENFYSAYNTANSGTAILLSSKQNEVSLEYGGLRQGVFSHFLIKGLKGNADKNNDKLISIHELGNFVTNQVKAYTANVQNPILAGDFDTNMPVALIR